MFFWSHCWKQLHLHKILTHEFVQTQPNYLFFLVFVFTLHSIHSLIRTLAFVHPKLRFFHNRPQLVQILFYLLVVVNILAGNKQLNLTWMQSISCTKGLVLAAIYIFRWGITLLIHTHTCLKAWRTSCLWLKCRKSSWSAPDTRGG